MIVSASRRTDLPALYPAWLRGRLKAGFAEVPHPFRPTQVRRVDLRPAPHGPLDALVLWTRDPGAVLSILVADCVPILMASSDGSAVAAVHAAAAFLGLDSRDQTSPGDGRQGRHRHPPVHNSLPWLGRGRNPAPET